VSGLNTCGNCLVCTKIEFHVAAVVRVVAVEPVVAVVRVVTVVGVVRVVTVGTCSSTEL